MSYLARALCEQRKYTEAETLLREALATEQRVLGPAHAKTLAVRHNLGIALRMSGQTSEAERIDRDTLEIRRRVLGPEHPETLASMLELAEVLDDLHRYADAEALYRENLAVTRRVLGPDHPDGASVQYNLACNLALRGRRSEALTLLRDAMDHGLPVRTALAIEHDSDFQSLHVDPRFTVLVADARRKAAIAQAAK
jgi:tetratricopeptide (TPR) repeat protein